MHIEVYIKEKLPPLHNAWYALWAHWWPHWRNLHSGPKILKKWHQFDLVKERQAFLDYGCGTGWFTIPAAKMVGDSGKVYALDCIPRHISMVQEKASKEGLSNIETILSEMNTGLPDESIDTVWLCDTYHEIREKRMLMEELYRILKVNGTLAIYDGMRDKALLNTEDLFSLAGKDDKFIKLIKKG